MPNITRMLQQIDDGDPSAAEKLLPLVYDELRKLAAARMADERSDHTLQPTALVHEAFLRLVGSENVNDWKSRGHFFGAAAEAMRRILIDRARDRKRLKRSHERRRLQLDCIELACDTPDEELLALDDALELLTQAYPDCGELVKLRFFAGLSLAESSAVLGIPPRSADRKWAFARTWLLQKLREDDVSVEPS